MMGLDKYMFSKIEKTEIKEIRRGFFETLSLAKTESINPWYLMVANEVDNYLNTECVKVTVDEFDIISMYCYNWIMCSECEIWKIAEAVVRGLKGKIYTIRDIQIYDDKVEDYCNDCILSL